MRLTMKHIILTGAAGVGKTTYAQNIGGARVDDSLERYYVADENIRITVLDYIPLDTNSYSGVMLMESRNSIKIGRDFDHLSDAYDISTPESRMIPLNHLLDL